jgi:pimeloyl-ACP methyl ester carboxylesterase
MQRGHIRRPSYDQRLRVASRDGWPLAVYEYLPRVVSASAVPVLCVHGLTCRYGIFDGGDGFGLAPYLARQGLHVFAVDLRGRGLSAPRGRLARTSALLSGWTLIDFLKKDLPTVFEHALVRAEATHLDVIAHSMGGMLTLELLAHTGDPRVRRVVTVGSGDAPAMLLPLSTEQVEARPQRKANVGMMMAPFALSVRYAPVHWGAKLGALTLPVTPPAVRARWVDPALRTLLNPDNVDDDVLRSFLWRSLSGISARKFWSFGRFYRKFRKQGAPRQRHRHPTLLLAGGGDHLVPPAKVRETLSRCTHPSSHMIELSQANGYQADYGHVDLLLGRHCEQEVFPLIHKFLAAEVSQEALSHEVAPDTGAADHDTGTAG